MVNSTENDWAILGISYSNYDISSESKAYIVKNSGNVMIAEWETPVYFRPSIVLNPGVFASGNGTLEKPYIID